VAGDWARGTFGIFGCTHNSTKFHECLIKIARADWINELLRGGPVTQNKPKSQVTDKGEARTIDIFGCCWV
jgi:hypothetical protein